MRLTATVLAAALLAGVAGCTSSGSAPAAVAAGGSEFDPGSAVAVRWGTAPRPTKDVTLQPDVVVVGGGGNSIRALTEDGLTYYLDPHAPRADRLARGKVMFVTSKAVGRVLDVRRAGADLAVTVGPVDLTGIIRDGHFATTAPVSLASPAAHYAGAPFWSAEKDPAADGTVGPGRFAGTAGPAGTEPPAGSGGPAGFARREVPKVPAIPTAVPGGVPGLPARPRLPDLPATKDLPAVPGRLPSVPGAAGELTRQVGASALKLLPICCQGGLGARFTYDKDGMRAVGTVGLTMSDPSAGFVLGIKGGTVTDARLRIDGAGGLKVSFEAARKDTRHEINERVAIPVDFRIPILQLFGGLSLDVVVNQWVVLKTAFSATGTWIKGTGEYTFAAGLGFGYRQGRWEASVPTSLTVTQSLQEDLTGLSVGPAGIVIAHQARFTVGVGAFGFVAGVYFNLTSSIGVSRGSDAGLSLPGTGGTKRLVCKGITVSLATNFGVGYSIPTPVTKLINFFLRVFRSDPIEKAGGIGFTPRPWTKSVIDPNTKICGGTG